jgi:hypothetical protein
MKIFYTTDGSVDDQLEQICPFGELHHFKRKDGTEYTMPKSVGCGGCTECPYCYGRGFQGCYGSGGQWVLIPKHYPYSEWNYEDDEQKKLELGMKQFRVISENDYILCAKCFNDDFRKKNLELKFKIWWWHHIGTHIDHLHYILDKWKIDTQVKVGGFFRNIKFNHIWPFS